MMKYFSGLLQSIQLTTSKLRRNELRGVYPIFFFLLVTALLLVIVNAFTPLVPFVYSLF